MVKRVCDICGANVERATIFYKLRKANSIDKEELDVCSKCVSGRLFGGKRPAHWKGYHTEETEATDVAQVVLCKDCEWRNWETNGCDRNPCVKPWFENDFCSYGERKDDEDS